MYGNVLIIKFLFAILLISLGALNKLFLVPKSAVYVMREETGLNPMDRCLTFREKILSLFSIRSVSNLMIRTRFAWKVPPIYARPTYFIVSMIKIFSQLLIGNYIAKRNKY